MKQVVDVLRALKRRLKPTAAPDHKAVFSRIYRDKRWGSDGASEFYSGPGSDERYTDEYVNVIRRFVLEHHVTSIVDLGCGDFRVGRKIADIDGVSITGVDVVDELIAHNNAHYASPRVTFVSRNIVTDALPDGELCLIRQVMQHLSNRDIASILAKCRKYKHLIVTEHLPVELSARPNMDKTPGSGIRFFSGSGVYLDLPPFNARVIELLTAYPEEHPHSKIVTYQVLL